MNALLGFNTAIAPGPPAYVQGLSRICSTGPEVHVVPWHLKSLDSLLELLQRDPGDPWPVLICSLADANLIKMSCNVGEWTPRYFGYWMKRSAARDLSLGAVSLFSFHSQAQLQEMLCAKVLFADLGICKGLGCPSQMPGVCSSHL